MHFTGSCQQENSCFNKNVCQSQLRPSSHRVLLGRFHVAGKCKRRHRTHRETKTALVVMLRIGCRNMAFLCWWLEHVHSELNFTRLLVSTPRFGITVFKYKTLHGIVVVNIEQQTLAMAVGDYGNRIARNCSAISSEKVCEYTWGSCLVFTYFLDIVLKVDLNSLSRTKLTCTTIYYNCWRSVSVGLWWL